MDNHKTHGCICSFFTGFVKQKSRLDSVYKERRALLSDVKVLRGRLESSKEQVNSLRGQVDSLQGQVCSLEASLRSFDALQAQYEHVKKQLAGQKIAMLNVCICISI